MAEGEPDGWLSGRSSTRWLLTVAAVAVICAIAAVWFFTNPQVGARGPAAEDTPAFEVPTEPIEGVSGESLAWYQNAGRGDVIVQDVRWETTGNQPPSEGHRYLVAELEIIATAGQLTVNPLYFSAVDSQLNEVFLATMAGYQPEVADVTLPAGQSLTAYASFDASPGPATLVFTDELFTPVLLVDVPGPQ